jgi:hypothetical protein
LVFRSGLVCAGPRRLVPLGQAVAQVWASFSSFGALAGGLCSWRGAPAMARGALGGVFLFLAGRRPVSSGQGPRHCHLPAAHPRPGHTHPGPALAKAHPRSGAFKDLRAGQKYSLQLNLDARPHPPTPTPPRRWRRAPHRELPRAEMTHHTAAIAFGLRPGKPRRHCFWSSPRPQATRQSPHPPGPCACKGPGQGPQPSPTLSCGYCLLAHAKARAVGLPTLSCRYCLLAHAHHPEDPARPRHRPKPTILKTLLAPARRPAAPAAPQILKTLLAHAHTHHPYVCSRRPGL